MFHTLILKSCDMMVMLEESAPLPHKQILTFSELKDEVPSTVPTLFSPIQGYLHHHCHHTIPLHLA
jgi:hypothetical protein